MEKLSVKTSLIKLDIDNDETDEIKAINRYLMRA